MADTCDELPGLIADLSPPSLPAEPRMAAGRSAGSSVIFEMSRKRTSSASASSSSTSGRPCPPSIRIGGPRSGSTGSTTPISRSSASFRARRATLAALRSAGAVRMGTRRPAFPSRLHDHPPHRPRLGEARHRAHQPDRPGSQQLVLRLAPYLRTTQRLGMLSEKEPCQCRNATGMSWQAGPAPASRT